MRKYIIAFIGIICLSNVATKAQGTFTIPAGTSIPLVLDYGISSEETKQGDFVSFSVPMDIYIGNNVAVPMGTKAIGEVIRASKRKSWGKGGMLTIKVKELQLGNGSAVPLTALDISVEGERKVKSAWGWFGGLIFFVPLNVIPPLCIKGGDAIINEGLAVTATTVKNVTITK